MPIHKTAGGGVQWGNITYQPDTGVFTNNEGKVLGTVRSDGYLVIWFEKRLWRANRLAWFFMTGEEPECVDHKDRNTLNNAFDNLRAANKSENACNSKLPSNNSSGCKGVTFCKQTGQWRVEINKNGKRFRKRVKSYESACTLAEIMRNKLHEDFANAN